MNRNFLMHRVKDLAQRLEQRSRRCPGMYPVEESDTFLRITMDEVGGVSVGLSQYCLTSLEELASLLEELLEHPQTSFHLAALSRIHRGETTVFSDSKATFPTALQKKA